MTRTWLVTGASSGFGLHICLKALAAGECVIGTVRDRSRSEKAVSMIENAGGKMMLLDNTWGKDKIKEAIDGAVAQYGEIDVLVNNAGSPITTAVENFTEDKARKQMEVCFFGPLFTTQAVLPSMRTRRTGLIISNTSASGQFSVPSGALYSAAKFALEGLTEGLIVETTEFGISHLIVQPGAFKTNFFGGMESGGEVGEEYMKGAVGKTLGMFDESHGNQNGSPEKAAERIVEFVRGEGLGGTLKGKVTRMLLGPDCWQMLNGKTKKLRQDVELGREVAESTDCD